MSGRLVGYAVARYRGPMFQVYLEGEAHLFREDAEDEAESLSEADKRSEYRVYEVREVTK
ncbi:hypothetical protein ACWDNI_35790 [Nocardia niigatensis]